MKITSIVTMARSTVLASLWASAILAMGGAMAAPSSCYVIKDGDKRAYCLATVKRDYQYCYRVKDDDRRNQCLAEIKGSRDRCYAIKENDARKACLAKLPS